MSSSGCWENIKPSPPKAREQRTWTFQVPLPLPCHLLQLARQDAGRQHGSALPYHKEPRAARAGSTDRLCPAQNVDWFSRGLIAVAVAVKGGVGVVATDLLMIFSRESGALLLKGSSILATMAFCRSLLSITVVWGTTLGNKRITKKKKTLKQQHSF